MDKPGLAFVDYLGSEIMNNKQNRIQPLEADLGSAKPLAWINPKRDVAALESGEFRKTDIDDAAANWAWLAPLLAELLPEAPGGLIQSELRSVTTAKGNWLVKCDHALPATGSIKARGGVYEVLMRAVIDFGETRPSDPRVLLLPDARARFVARRIVVGSTGNLGFSVGLIARRLGYEVDVHMSHDAKDWKKSRLRDMGARVVVHADDYSQAVASAREDAARDPKSYFVDDEDSPTLFLGYAAAALELADQLRAQGIEVSATRPLDVYLPCGVGGAPGGVAFGLTAIYGAAVRPILVEPVAAPCMMAQLMHGCDASVSVYDYGLDNRTAADGLAVARASMLVAREMARVVAAAVTVTDDDLFLWAARMWQQAELRLEPSAASGFAAVARHSATLHDGFGGPDPTRIIWTTGGALLPDAEFEAVLKRGRDAESNFLE